MDKNLAILNDLYERLVIEDENGAIIAIIGEDIQIREGYQARLRPVDLEEIPFDDFEEEEED